MTFIFGNCLCVCDQSAYADNCADAVDCYIAHGKKNLDSSLRTAPEPRMNLETEAVNMRAIYI